MRVCLFVHYLVRIGCRCALVGTRTRIYCHRYGTQRYVDDKRYVIEYIKLCSRPFHIA